MEGWEEGDRCSKLTMEKRPVWAGAAQWTTEARVRGRGQGHIYRKWMAERRVQEQDQQADHIGQAGIGSKLSTEGWQAGALVRR